ncbi:MAG: type II toxin-antitoxin system YhaV family toxin [Alphaproteobacteria bacterium]|nr:MAG: type II toxin-antitoxin system YhaV family toxin [Alphaproteobacteria bacterium]
MAVANGWTLYEHPLFADQRDRLLHTVEKRRAKDPQGWQGSAEAKLLAAIARLTLEIIPADPAAAQFRQGGTLGKARKHWFRAKFGNGRYRLFFQFNSAARVIIYAWVNDAETLRAYGGRRDAYAVFKAMLDKGDPPESWAELLKAVRGRK